MHPKNPFAKDYDFDNLVAQHPQLKKHVFVNEYGTKTVDFSDQKAVKTLNAALLKASYGIDWEIPKNYLCPPVPGRLEYLLHVADLIPEKPLHILDIGAGASLIYPILATSHFNWKCTAAEVDKDSIAHAKKIIDHNEALQNIELRVQASKGNILRDIIKPTDQFDVLICNPPFHKSALDAQKENQRKFNNLKLKGSQTLNFGGRATELWCKGGEKAFIEKLVKESTQFKTRVKWFTSLVSRKEHVGYIKRVLGPTKPKEVRVIDMTLGNKKSRFIAWTYL